MMKFEQQAGYLLNHASLKKEEESTDKTLTSEERESILARSELRRGGQVFKTNVLNLEKPKMNDVLRGAYEKTLEKVFSEVKGNIRLRENRSKEELLQEALILEQKAEEKRDIFPRYSAFLFLQAVQLRERSDENFSAVLAKANDILGKIRNVDPNTPSNLLPEAMLLGIRARQISRSLLPEKHKVAETVSVDPELLASYALVLPEKERDEFLRMIPEKKQQTVTSLLDVSVSSVLHQSLVEKKSDEESQRSKVRLRLYNELCRVVEENEKEDAVLAKILAEAIGSLGEDTRQFLLEILRDEKEGQEDGSEEQNEHIPRIMKVLLDNFDDFRGNDLVLQLAGDRSINPHLAIYFFGKLIEKKYLPEDVRHWWSEEKAVRGKGLVAEKNRLEVIQRVVSDLGVMPSREILGFISDDKQWGDISIEDRIGKIGESQKEFSSLQNNHDLAELLRRDEQKAMMYYLLHGGDDRFNLINNYSFDKFREMIGLIDDLKIHEQPMRQFDKALNNGGVSKTERMEIGERLRKGKFPLGEGVSSRAEISFDVSENAVIKNANGEIGRVLGRKQLGVVMAFPLYRNYLTQNTDTVSTELLERMKKAQTLADRVTLLDQIEAMHPDFRGRAIDTLKENWKVFGDKMTLELSLEQVFGDESVVIRGEELLPRLDAKRFDLKRMKKDLMVLLKGGNKRLAKLQSDIAKKRKARANLLEGLDRQTDDGSKQSIREKITGIEDELLLLEQEKLMMSDQKTMDRFAGMTEAERKEEIEKIGSEILALTEKSPSAIFTYITMQVLGEEMLRESDIVLVQEVESHLQGPFQAIADTTTYQKSPLDRGEKKRMRLTLEYLDKTERFMNTVRFADSKICCFSSNNYEQTIQHGTPNKYWVASINADPLSFVLSLEMPVAIEEKENKKRMPKENLGFIFGNYGMDKNGELAILLNGIYYAPGIEGQEQVDAILDGVEKVFSGLPIRTIALAEQYGGSLGEAKAPSRYTKQNIDLIRLRALDDNSGDPETKIYDDLGTGEHLNQMHSYGGNVWHKSREKSEKR